MAISVISIGTPLNSSTDATSYSTTGTPTPAAGALLIAAVDVQRATSNPGGPTATGWGLTWGSSIANAIYVGSGSTRHRLFVFVALTGGAPTSGDFTADFGATTQVGCSIAILQATGVDVTGTAAQAVVQIPTNTGSSTTGSVTMAGAANPANRMLGVIAHQANEVTTPRTNWTELTDLTHASPSSACETEWRSIDALESPTATWSTSSLWGAIGLELKAEGTSYSVGMIPI